MQGNYEGVVESCKWSKYHDEESNHNIAILGLSVKVGDQVVFSSLFFDRELVQSGMDAGKERMKVSLETLKSYGVKCNPDNYTDNQPATFGEQLKGMTVNVYLDEKDKKQRAFLNRKTRPELKEDEVLSLWGELAGNEPQKADAADPKEEKQDDLVF